MDPSLLDSKLEQIQDKIRNGGHLGIDDAYRKRFVNGQSEEDAGQSSPRTAVLPKDPMSHIADFSQRLMERVMNKRKKKKKQGSEMPSSLTAASNGGCEQFPEVQPVADPTVYHVVVPIPEDEIAAERVGVSFRAKVTATQFCIVGRRRVL